MKEEFIEKRFSAKSEYIINKAESIINEYTSQGFKLTLRQLYYQFVARDLIENSINSYKRLGIIISNARLAGRIDWDSIEDRTRNLEYISHWPNPASMIKSARQSYSLDKWKNQEYRIEVWIEKEALSGIIEPVCTRYDVSYFSCRGYVSQSEQYAAGNRFLDYGNQGQRVLILHLGDHDPSGIDMTRDNQDRLNLFSGYVNVEVKRIALNMGQIEELNPPPNPAKLTDSRCANYISKFGPASWELDALDPTYIDDLIGTEINNVMDHDKWAETIKKEDKDKKVFEEVENRWVEVKQFLGC